MESGRSRQSPITVLLRELDPRRGVSLATASPRDLLCEFRSASPMGQYDLEASRANPTHATSLLAWPLVSTGQRTDSQPHLRGSLFACSAPAAPVEFSLMLAIAQLGRRNPDRRQSSHQQFHREPSCVQLIRLIPTSHALLGFVGVRQLWS